MNSKEHLIEQQILEYESRLRHIDELYERAKQAAENQPDADTENPHLQALASHREL